MNRAGSLRTLVLALWAAFFVWLLATGEVYRYIGPRTRWVVVFGAIVFAAAALVQGAAALGHRPGGRVGPSDVIAAAAFVAPLAIVVAIPRPSLGSEAAARRSIGAVPAIAAGAPAGGGDVTVADIELASSSARYAAGAGLVPGTEVEVTGFVTHPPEGRPGTFALTRFATFCCAADAVPYSATVVSAAGAGLADDTWLTVTGVVAARGGGLVVEATRIERIDEPRNPYL